MLGTETIINWSLAIGALVLAAVTAGSSYPFWWKVGFVSVGAVLVWVLLWRWERSKNWRALLKVFISCVGSLLFLILLQPPLQGQFNDEFNIKLDFKAAPELTWWLQIRTQYDLS